MAKKSSDVSARELIGIALINPSGTATYYAKDRVAGRRIAQNVRVYLENSDKYRGKAWVSQKDNEVTVSRC